MKINKRYCRVSVTANLAEQLRQHWEWSRQMDYLISAHRSQSLEKLKVMTNRDTLLKYIH